MRDLGRALALLIVASSWLACSGEPPSSSGTLPRAAASDEAPEPTVEPTTTEALAPPSTPAPAPASFAPPSRAAIAGGCTASPATTLPLPRHGNGIGIAAHGDAGLVVYLSDHSDVVAQPIDGHGAPRGDAHKLELDRVARVWAVSRIGAAFVAAISARCPNGRGLCLFAQRLDEQGQAIGAPAHAEISMSSTPLAPVWPSESTGTTMWIAGAFDTSHDGEGVQARAIRLGEDGTPTIGRLETFNDDLPDGAGLTGWRVAATETELAAIYGANGEDPEWDGDREPSTVSRRYVGRSGREGRTISGLGSIVEDLAFLGTELRVLVMRSRDAYAMGTIGPDGALAGALSPIDVAAPLPEPFRDRALAVLEGDEPTRDFVVRDSAGRRLGERIRVRGEDAALAWTGERFLVALGEGTRASVVAIECTP